MNTFIKINSINYPAEIYGHVRDRDWDNRESKVIILSLTIEEALSLFTDNVQWSIVYGTQTIPQDDFIIAGPITDNRNGTVSVRMGKPTAAEVSTVITGEQIDNICDTNYNLATNTTAIIQNAHNDTDRVIAKLDAMEMARKDETISELRSQVNALNLAQSQANQNTYLINTLRPCPQPAYISCNPWAGSGYGGCGTYSNCGCGC